MPLERFQLRKICTLKPCTGSCSGYDTRSNCPPLIVLAVAAVQTVAATLCLNPATTSMRATAEAGC